MEDADLEEIRAKRLAQLQSEYRVNYEFIWSSFFAEIWCTNEHKTYVFYYYCMYPKKTSKLMAK